MARKTAVAEPPADPAAERRAVINRVLARRPQPGVRSYPAVDGGEPLKVVTPANGDRTAPGNLQEWIDDRELANFGGRTKLCAAEQASFNILTSFRSGDLGTVRTAVTEAGRSVDDWTRNMVLAVLEEWRGKAPGFALDIANAATGTARQLGWDVQPRRRRRREAA
jgi:hypothetical protein